MYLHRAHKEGAAKGPGPTSSAFCAVTGAAHQLDVARDSAYAILYEWVSFKLKLSTQRAKTTPGPKPKPKPKPMPAPAPTPARTQLGVQSGKLSLQRERQRDERAKCALTALAVNGLASILLRGAGREREDFVCSQVQVSELQPIKVRGYCQK